MSKPYYTLIVKYEKADVWAIAFGDYDKDCVQDEREDSYEDSYKTRIICTHESQAAIEAKVAELNKE